MIPAPDNVGLGNSRARIRKFSRQVYRYGQDIAGTEIDFAGRHADGQLSRVHQYDFLFVPHVLGRGGTGRLAQVSHVKAMRP
jgi:hypothetical protein